MGFKSRVLSPLEIRDRLQLLTGTDRLDGSAIKNIPSGGGLSPWQLKTSNYTASSGDRLRIDASAGDVVITLPNNPNSSDSDIWIQKLDTSGNRILLRTGNKNINLQSGKDGIFNPAAIDNIEVVSYVDASVGWLGQNGLLTYQNAPPPLSAVDPYWANVTLLLRADSSGFSDLKGATISSLGATVSPNAAFGHSIKIFNGYLSIPNPSTLISPTGDWTIDFWYREISTSQYGRIFGLGVGDYPLSIYRASVIGNNIIAAVGSSTTWYEQNIDMGAPSATQADYYGLKREGGIISGWKNGVQISSKLLNNTDAIGIPTGNAMFGVNQAYNCNCNIEEFRITNVARDLSIVPIGKHPTI